MASATAGTEVASNPNPGEAASPHLPENVAPGPNTIFWRAEEFGFIKGAVYAIFSGGAYMWSDAVPSSAETGRTDFEANLENLRRVEKRIS